MLHAAHACATAGTGDRHDDAPDRAREAGLVEQRLNFLLRSLRIAQSAGVPDDRNR